MIKIYKAGKSRGNKREINITATQEFKSLCYSCILSTATCTESVKNYWWREYKFLFERIGWPYTLPYIMPPLLHYISMLKIKKPIVMPMTPFLT